MSFAYIWLYWHRIDKMLGLFSSKDFVKQASDQPRQGFAWTIVQSFRWIAARRSRYRRLSHPKFCAAESKGRAWWRRPKRWPGLLRFGRRHLHLPPAGPNDRKWSGCKPEKLKQSVEREPRGLWMTKRNGSHLHWLWKYLHFAKITELARKHHIFVTNLGVPTLRQA